MPLIVGTGFCGRIVCAELISVKQVKHCAVVRVFDGARVDAVDLREQVPGGQAMIPAPDHVDKAIEGAAKAEPANVARPSAYWEGMSQI